MDPEWLLSERMNAVAVFALKKSISVRFPRTPTLAFHSSSPPQCGQSPGLMTGCYTAYSASQRIRGLSAMVQIYKLANLKTYS